jgi:hypothetical protein
LRNKKTLSAYGTVVMGDVVDETLGGEHLSGSYLQIILAIG